MAMENNSKASAKELFEKCGFTLASSIVDGVISFENDNGDFINFEPASKLWWTSGYIDFSVDLTKAIISEMKHLKWM